MFADEYLALVIRPKLVPILSDCSSVTELVARFNDQWGCEVSRGRMCEWLRGLGITMQRKVVFSGALNTVTPPREHDGPTMREAHEAIAYGPRPGKQEVEGEMLFPGFTNMSPPGSMFANVPMPGFSE